MHEVRRDENGRFLPGYSPKSPGRPPAAYEDKLANARTVALEILAGALTEDKWRAIVEKQLELAAGGNADAVKWISGYVLGQPGQTVDLRMQMIQQGITVEAVDDYRSGLAMLAPLNEDADESTDAETPPTEG